MLESLEENPIEKLQKLYAEILDRAINAQLDGKSILYNKLYTEATKIGQKIDRLKLQERLGIN